MQAKKIKYDVIGLTETRRCHPLNTVYETGEELFLGTCDSRGVGGVGVLVNTSMAKNTDSFEHFTSRIGRLRMRRCGPTPALTIFVAYAPTSSCEEVETFYMEMEKFYREDHAFYKVIIGDFNAKVGPRRTPEELHIGTHGLQWNDQGERLSEFIMTTKTIHGNSQFQKPSSLRWTWESPGGGYRNEIDHIIVNKRFCLTDVAVVPKFYTGSDHRLLRGRFSFTRRAEKAAKFRERNPRTTINWDLFATLALFWEDSAMDNIDEEYDRLVEHLHDCAKKAESFKTTKRRLSLETLELIRQRGAARAAGNQELTSELARLCREVIKEDLKERRAEVLAEAAEAGKNISYAHRDFAGRKTRMTALRTQREEPLHREGRWRKSSTTSTLISSTAMFLLTSSPSEGRWTSHSRGSPVRNTTCYHVGKKSYGTRSRQNKTRTPEEPSASTHQHPGEALYTLSVGMQGS
ncbi:hypothetical protein RB195_019865 [Necator americanus]|uniref:Endonuclease/exonuclease/phosphatase domain-containing protein n=1 Tax=Necator americanus TaxID=51031 RepID=A0ABR1CG50_NECAM